ncbi:MAG TPA: ferrous iron transport protein A [Firmicutes bacterium]|nr:ferrous iron transport protein A [Bacillota bacterium]
MGRTVNDLKIGEKAVVTGLGCSGALRRRIIDMGITPGAVVILRKAAPMGDPLEINVRGYELSIRRSEAREITVVGAEEEAAAPSGGEDERAPSGERGVRSRFRRHRACRGEKNR